MESVTNLEEVKSFYVGWMRNVRIQIPSVMDPLLIVSQMPLFDGACKAVRRFKENIATYCTVCLPLSSPPI